MSGRVSYGDRLLESESELGFGSDMHLGALGGLLSGGASCASYACANRRALPMTQNSADNRTDGSASANRFGGAGRPRLADIMIIVAGKIVRGALEVEAGELQGQLAAAGHMAGRARVGELHVNVRATRHDGFAIDDDRRSKGSVEDIAGVVRCGVDAVNHLDMHRRSAWDADLPDDRLPRNRGVGDRRLGRCRTRG
jgi:hypothetical protein